MLVKKNPSASGHEKVPDGIHAIWVAALAQGRARLCLAFCSATQKIIEVVSIDN
jgi:hypothetical protein